MSKLKKQSIRKDKSYVDELVELADSDKNDAVDAVEIILQKHIERIMDARREFAVNDTDLLTENISRVGEIPSTIRKNLGCLHDKLRRVIREVALNIETRNYRSQEEALNEVINEAYLSSKQKGKVEKIIDADKRMHISTQSLNLTVNICSELNRRIVKNLEECERTGERHIEANILLGNAILIYELADFAIDYINSFKLEGLDEILEIRDDICEKIKQTKKNLEKQKQRSELQDVSEDMRQRFISSQENKINLCELILKEWEGYVKEIEDSQSDLASSHQNLSALILVKADAKSQLDILQLAAVVRVLRENCMAIDSIVNSIQGLDLITIDPPRLRRLMGVDL